MPKVMFFAHDPGGANAISPLIPEFKEPLVFGKGPALDILPNVRQLSGDVLKSYWPDFIITGTSCNDFTEKYLWKEADALGIKSMAILDSWINYGIRFSRYGTKDLHLFQKECDYLPSYICVMDEIAREDMISDGVPENIILPFGNPHFEYMTLKAIELQDIGKKILDKYIITFASQPFDDIHRKDSEIKALEDLIEITKDRSDIIILIRKHPKEIQNKFEKYLNDKIRFDNSPLLLSIISSDIIVSVNSMVLIEAIFFHKKIISYQPKAVNINDFILTRNKTVPFITNTNDLRTYLFKLLETSEFNIDIKFPVNGIIPRIKNFISEKANA
jgi:hypothetical protein